jgi:hypothetical protein
MKGFILPTLWFIGTSECVFLAKKLWEWWKQKNSFFSIKKFQIKTSWESSSCYMYTDWKIIMNFHFSMGSDCYSFILFTSREYRQEKWYALMRYLMQCYQMIKLVPTTIWQNQRERRNAMLGIVWVNHLQNIQIMEDWMTWGRTPPIQATCGGQDHGERYAVSPSMLSMHSQPYQSFLSNLCLAICQGIMWTFNNPLQFFIR